MKISLQKTSSTSIVLVPAGCTALVQLLDVSFNCVLKSAVKRLQNEHMHKNLKSYVNGSIPVGQRRILFSSWVGEAWAERKQEQRVDQESI